jgi:hypothetical protein
MASTDTGGGCDQRYGGINTVEAQDANLAFWVRNDNHNSLDCAAVGPGPCFQLAIHEEYNHAC